MDKKYYETLFVDSGLYSSRYPNTEEIRRWSKISEYISRIAECSEEHIPQLRILDVGCGRGWMTKLTSIYGQCDGIEPVKEVIDYAKYLYPELNFYAESLEEFASRPNLEKYDLLICSEVIEHVQEKIAFIAQAQRCLVPGGSIIISSPRAEYFKKYKAALYDLQPVEEWLTEQQMQALFEQFGFYPVDNDRVYEPMSRISYLHRLINNSSAQRLSRLLNLHWCFKGLMHVASIYQVWWFQDRKKMIDRAGCSFNEVT